MKVRYRKISKREWCDRGGFANPKLFRKADRRGAWRYYMLA